MTTLAEKIRKYETVKRGNCIDCDGPWWFSEEHSDVCTRCAKTVGRSTSDEYKIREVRTRQEGVANDVG